MFQGQKLYSVYYKATCSDGNTEWVGTHRLPIRFALRQWRELRDRGLRTTLRLDSERGPSYVD